MNARKRIVLVVVVLGLFAGVCGGVWIYVRYNSWWRIQARMHLAMQANQFEKAAEHARAYIEKRPGEWDGYYWLAQCYTRMGRYDEARKEIQNILDKPSQMGCDLVSVRMLLADTHAHEALQAMSGSGAGRQWTVLNAGVKQLEQANAVLQGTSTADKAKELDLLQAQGRNDMQIGAVCEQLASLSDKAAQAAQDQNRDSLAKEENDKAAGFRNQSKKAYVEAQGLLMRVIQADAARPQPAAALVQLCLKRDDRAALEQARKAILSLEDPPPLAAMMLEIDEAGQGLNRRPEAPSSTSSSAPASSGAPRMDRNRQIVEDLCARLDRIIAKHPEEAEVKTRRGEFALRLNDEATAERLCKEVLAKDDRNYRARMLHAQILTRKGNLNDAERVLFEIKTGNNPSPESLYRYAMAAVSSGKRELARQSLRQLTALNPNDPYERSYVAKAYRYLADSLAQDGFPAQAFDDAQKYYRLFPEDPAAIVMFVDLSKRSDQPNLAREEIKKIEADPARMRRPEMLVAVAEGYLLLGEAEDKKKSNELIQRIGQFKGETLEGQLAVARALKMTGQFAQAETLLKDLLAQSAEPPLAEALYGLGQLYVQEGRMLEAVEMYRAAVRQDAVNSTYRASLARTLFEAGDLEECESVLSGIEPGNAVANLLRLQVQIAKGEAGDSGQMLQQAMQAGISGLPAAVAYMSNGQPRQCIDVCEAELKKRTSDEAYLRSLMGQAYLSLGERDKCVEQWKQVIALSPTQTSMYLGLTALLSQDPDPAKPADPDRAAAEMAKIANVRADLIQFSHAWMLGRLKKYAEAAEKFRRLAERTDAGEPIRGRARLMSARALAQAGQVDKALEELDRLAQKAPWPKEAMYQKVQILLSADRKPEARVALNGLRGQAVKERDEALLRRVISLQAAARNYDDALAACDELRKLLPNEPRGQLMKAETLYAAGRGAEAITAFEESIRREPGNFSTYLKLSRALDAEQKSVEALEVLDRLAQFGEAGRAESIYQRGLLLAQWGLQAQAVDCLGGLDKSHLTTNPRLQLALGRDMMALGRADHAQAILARIPVYAKEYVQAQLGLAALAPSLEAKLQALDGLEAKRPGLPAVLQEKMGLLIRAERFADAIAAYEKFAKGQPANAPVPENLSYAALMAMLQSGRQSAAVDLAARIARQSRSPYWRKYELFLKSESDRPAALALLPEPAKADGQDASLGLCMAVETNSPDEMTKWSSRLTEVEANLAKQKPPRSMPNVYKLLISLATKDWAQAKAGLAKFDSRETIAQTTAAELVASAEGGKSSPVEAARLLRASIADEIGLPVLTTRWSAEVLKARPTCQMAAALAFRGQTTLPGRKAILDLLQPADCSFAKQARAFLCAQDKQFEQAAKLLGEARAAEGDNVELMVQQAVALENAGKPQEALPLYMRAWELGKSPVAANNAAYLIAQLYEKDPARLAEAEKVIAGAIKVSPNVPAIRETLGWIRYLRGQKEQACKELRGSIRGVSDSPEAHYHLGVVEAALGNQGMARFHLEAAVAFAEKKKKEGAGTVSVDRALVQAQQMLKTLPAPKT